MSFPRLPIFGWDLPEPRDDDNSDENPGEKISAEEVKTELPPIQMGCHLCKDSPTPGFIQKGMLFIPCPACTSFI